MTALKIVSAIMAFTGIIGMLVCGIVGEIKFWKESQ